MKMTKVPAEKFDEFLKKLDILKQDFTCAHCKKFLVKPVTLSTCFHMICAEHIKSLKSCPTCSVSLKDVTTYEDEHQAKSVELIIQLNNQLKNIKPTENETSTSRNSQKTTSGGKENIGNVDLNKSVLSNASYKINKDIEKRNLKGETKLHINCRLGKVDTVLQLLEMGANPNTKDYAGWTPLHEVVQGGNLDLVKHLLSHNTLIDVPGPSNETPLHEAVRYEYKDVAIELVKHGADLEAKNCKGETPLQLASEDMRELLLEAERNIQQTQGINVTHIARMHSELDYEDIHVYSISKFRTVDGKLKKLVKKHANLHIEAKFTEKVTHLIVDVEDDETCVSSADVLQAIVCKLWILSSEWVTTSNDKALAKFDDYEVKGIGSKMFNGPYRARYNKYKKLKGLFDGCHFYLHNFVGRYEVSKSLTLTKPILTKLITDAGGTVLRRVPNPESVPENLFPYHARKGGKLEKCSHFIIFKDTYEPQYNMAHIKALPVGWLIDCIHKYELCDPE